MDHPEGLRHPVVPEDRLAGDHCVPIVVEDFVEDIDHGIDHQDLPAIHLGTFEAAAGMEGRAVDSFRNPDDASAGWAVGREEPDPAAVGSNLPPIVALPVDQPVPDSLRVHLVDPVRQVAAVVEVFAAVAVAAAMVAHPVALALVRHHRPDPELEAYRPEELLAPH